MSYVYHALVAVLCIGASYGFNQHQRPAFEPTYAPEQYGAVTGSLSLRYAAETRDVELMSMHIVLHDVTRMGRAFAMRELAVRAVAPAAQQAPLELYVDLSKLRLDPGDAARDPRSLAQQELPVLRTGRFGARRSTLTLQGDKPSQVVSGTLLFTEITPLETGDHASYRASGRVELQVAGEHGVDMVTGRIDGQLEWDPS
jgi:hypothetical protein